MTNEERIKNMSTEELVKFLWSNGVDCNCCKFCFGGDECKRKICKAGMAEWLKEDAEE